MAIGENTDAGVIGVPKIHLVETPSREVVGFLLEGLYE
jgi:hypothetical protein